MAESGQTILVVDDDASIRKLLKRCFESESYTVFEAASGSDMFALLQQHPIDLITLDLSLGGEDGLDLARQVRAESSVSIIMVSGRGELIDKVVGLEVGADDYISKPFELREVIARVRSVLRRSQQTSPTDKASESAPTDNKYYFNQWVLDPATRELMDRNDTICELTTGEYDLLEVLVTHARRVLSRDQIMDAIKGMEWNPTDRTIDNQVARLRKKLQPDDGGGAQMIKTVRGSGYMFTPEVTRSAEE